MKWSMKKASRLSRVLISQMNLYIKFVQEMNINYKKWEDDNVWAVGLRYVG